MGETRTEVGTNLKPWNSRNHPAWGLYKNPSEQISTPILVNYRLDWEDSDSDTWRVTSVSGVTLEIGEDFSFSVGDSVLTLLFALGKSDERFEIESGYYCYRFGTCVVTVDSPSEKVVEFALQPNVECFVRPCDRPAPLLMDGALAC